LLPGPTARCTPPTKERSPSPPARPPPPPPPPPPSQQKRPSGVDRLTGNGSSGSDVDLEDVVFMVGDALLDVCADVDQLFLTKYGLNADDIILARPDHKGITQAK
jgi:hypothetical protein